MNLRNWVVGSIIAGGIGLCITSGFIYQYVTKLNKNLDTYVLPHTTLEGMTLDGKTKQEVQQMIQQKLNQLNQQSISYSLQGVTNTYTRKDLGVYYKTMNIAETIFDEQKGTIIERYNLHKRSQKGQLKREYHLEAYIESNKYDAFMKDKYNDILLNPENASISITGTNISVIPSKNGEKVDKDKLKALTNEAVKTKNANIIVPVTAVQPERTTEDVQSMGIKEIIAEYRSPMNGRNGNQVFNIARAAQSLNETIIAPDEVFSFNDRVGVTDSANGYKLAAVFLNGRVQQSAGGGVCQVSSTLYGAVLRADLSIEERSNHSMPVHYVPLGQDATVADYGPDLKFKNNTGHYIYLQASIENNHTVVRIFGTSTGKSVALSSKVVSETAQNIVVMTYKTVTQNGQVIESGLLHKSTYKKSA